MIFRHYVTKYIMQTQRQLTNFIIVGVINTLFGYSLYAFFIFLGFPYPIALFLATCIGVVFNFKTVGKFVFSSKTNDHFLKFIMVYGGVYAVTVVLIKIMELYINNLYLASLVAIGASSVLTFVLNKYIVFRTQSENSSPR